MQTKLNENLKKLYHCSTQPLLDLTQLNITTLKNIENKFNNNLNDHPEKPEDLIASQIRLTNVIMRESIEYTKEAMKIGQGYIEKVSEIMADSFVKPTDAAESFTKHKNNKNQS